MPTKSPKPIKLPKSLPRPWSYGCLGGAFEAGDKANGMRFLQKGFGHTPDDDRLFALGYPYVVIPVDIEVDLAAHAGRVPSGGGAWPRGVVEHYLRFPDKGLDAAAYAPNSALDFATIAPTIVMIDVPRGEVYMYMLEAIFGSTRTLEAAVSAWENVSDWQKLDGFDLPNTVPFILLRVDEKTRQAYLERLRVVHARADQQLGELESRVVPSLARAAGLPEKELEYWTAPYALPGDAAAIDFILNQLSTMKPADHGYVDARLAFLGGARTTAAVAEAVVAGRFHSSSLKAAVEQLPRLNHPAIAAAMAKLATKESGAKAWLAAQANDQ